MTRSRRYERTRLRFSDHDIWCVDTCSHVMMDWERPLMRRHAEIACHNRGDVLEIGFGMGLSADVIQEHAPRSHTIVECHPQVVERLRTWAAGRPGVVVVEGAWFDVREHLGTFDGIFYDAIHDPHFRQLPTFVTRALRPGGRFTFFNNLIGTNRLGLPARYEVLDIDPPPNGYVHHRKYWLPIVER